MRRLHFNVLLRPYTMAHQCVVGFVIMKERYFDDLKVGDRFKSEPLTVTEKEVIEFAHKFDPQMFHLSRKPCGENHFQRTDCQRLAHRGDEHAAVRANAEFRRGRNRTRRG